MVQRSNYAALMGAQIKFRWEECAKGMEQRSNDALLMVAQNTLRKEECALSIGQHESKPPSSAQLHLQV